VSLFCSPSPKPEHPTIELLLVVQLGLLNYLEVRCDASLAFVAGLCSGVVYCIVNY
jgi:hypothetical protein